MCRQQNVSKMEIIFYSKKQTVRFSTWCILNMRLSVVMFFRYADKNKISKTTILKNKNKKHEKIIFFLIFYFMSRQ